MAVPAVVVSSSPVVFVLKRNGGAVIHARLSVWSGVGTALTGAIGILYFKEPATAVKMVSLTLIVIGVMGLHSASVAKQF